MAFRFYFRGFQDPISLASTGSDAKPSNAFRATDDDVAPDALPMITELDLQLRLSKTNARLFPHHVINIAKRPYFTLPDASHAVIILLITQRLI